MSTAATVRDLLVARVPPLANSTQLVADLAALIAAGALPQKSPAAFVVPSGFDAREPDDAAGVHVQTLDEVTAVVLIVQAPGDVTAQRALPLIDDLITAVNAALAGTVPAGALAALRPRRGRLLSINGGAVWYQIDFALQSQLRVPQS